MTQHDHVARIEGCFRCDLGADEVPRADLEADLIRAERAIVLLRNLVDVMEELHEACLEARPVNIVALIDARAAARRAARAYLAELDEVQP